MEVDSTIVNLPSSTIGVGANKMKAFVKKARVAAHSHLKGLGLNPETGEPYKKVNSKHAN